MEKGREEDVICVNTLASGEAAALTTCIHAQAKTRGGAVQFSMMNSGNYNIRLLFKEAATS